MNGVQWYHEMNNGSMRLLRTGATQGTPYSYTVRVSGESKQYWPSKYYIFLCVRGGADIFLHLNMFLAGREAERCRLLQLRCRKYSRRNSFQVYFHNFRVLSRSMHINEHLLHLSVSL